MMMQQEPLRESLLVLSQLLVCAAPHLCTSGKLPLLELEVEGVEALKGPHGLDCLALFLKPPSQELHEQRIQQWSLPSKEDAEAHGAHGVAATAAARASGVFDEVGIHVILYACVPPQDPWQSVSIIMHVITLS
jgi:hypothetical protein